MDKQFNLITVIEAIQKRFKIILIILLVVTAATWIITLPSLGMMKAKYESTTMFYSANLSLTDRPYLFESKSAINIDFSLFGNRDDIDRLVSIAQSRQLMKELVNKFNLMKHYKINEHSVKYPEAAAISRFKSNYKAMKSEFNSVELHLVDIDRDLAAEILNEAVNIIDQINRDMVMEGRQRMVDLLEKHTTEKREELTTLFHKISETNDESERSTLELQKDLSTQQLTYYYNMLDQFKLITTNDISTVRVMEKAVPAEKEEPTRYFLVAGAFFATLFVLIFGATILHVMTK